MLALRPYTARDASAWDALVARSRNGNLLHRRGYMDYHAERFVDASLMIERKGALVAVFPANRERDDVVSHGGLTYAGLIMSDALRAEATLAVFEVIAEHYRRAGARRLLYKAVPHVFHAFPAEEDLYALHRFGARVQRRDLSSVIALRDGYRFGAARRRSVARARKADIELRSGDAVDDFHGLLVDVLRKHDAAPTHSVDELRLLCGRFPREIVLHEALCNGSLLAGVLIYDFGAAVHTQYLAVSDAGREVDALSLLLAHLIERVYADRRHFSFGISTEHQGRTLNAGLVAQKERFGARTIVHDHYEWTL